MATAVVDSLLEQLTRSGAVDKAAVRLGIPPDKANAAVGAAIPAIMAGLAKNSQSSDGAASLSTALDKDHDGTVLEDDTYFDNYHEKKGDRILGHVFGDKEPAVEQEVGQASGLSAGQSADLLKMLAPLVMGYLAKEKASGGFNLSDLAQIFGGGSGGSGGDLSKSLPGGLGEILGSLAGGGETASTGAAPGSTAATKPKPGGALGGILSSFFKKK